LKYCDFFLLGKAGKYNHRKDAFPRGRFIFHPMKKERAIKTEEYLVRVYESTQPNGSKVFCVLLKNFQPHDLVLVKSLNGGGKVSPTGDGSVFPASKDERKEMPKFKSLF
jgi:hypothetical protein